MGASMMAQWSSRATLKQERWAVAERMRLEGRTAVITGAASGIGRAIAVSLAQRGCNLALADIDESGMAGTVDLTKRNSINVSRHRLDVADRAAVAEFADIVAGEHGGVDLLVNNAGVAVGGTFEQVVDEDFEWLFDINFWGVVRMTRAFLPLLRASEDARIVNLSSVYGLIGPPEQVAYAASKFAVRGFSEALRHELEGSNIGVTVVHPGGVATAIAEKARIPAGVSEEEIAQRRKKYRKLLRLPPEAAGETIVRGIERRRSRILIGSDAKTISLIARLLPVSYWKLIMRMMGK
jgi:NAD(P)-dependent dehydrogenase (short-subunit alcohol dehydrogenase family)